MSHVEGVDTQGGKVSTILVLSAYSHCWDTCPMIPSLLCPLSSTSGCNSETIAPGACWERRWEGEKHFGFSKPWSGSNWASTVGEGGGYLDYLWALKIYAFVSAPLQLAHLAIKIYPNKCIDSCLFFSCPISTILIYKFFTPNIFSLPFHINYLFECSPFISTSVVSHSFAISIT